MTEATLIYPHQLFLHHPALAPHRPIFLIEEPLFFCEFPTHRQKLLLHHLSMGAYAKELVRQGYQVTIVPIRRDATTASIFTWLAAHHFTTVHIVDTTDDWLESRIAAACATHSLTRHSYESPLFYLPKTEAMERYQKSKRHLARFYETLRRETGLLLEEDGTPCGGRFSFDRENRKKIPRGVTPPPEPQMYENSDIQEALTWLTTVPGEHYGETPVWLPYTHETAAQWLESFLAERLENFGPYEDAISATATRLWHSTLSPLLNIGLLTPPQVIHATLRYAKEHEVPLPSLEGFIRQVIGWREFIRAAYEVDGRSMRKANFWQHTRPLPKEFWTGTTTIAPVDDSIRKALTYGYTHHIERLMILGNFMLLTEINPRDVYRWFMAMYIDAYDWVMVPNVYGMSQFADGGSFTTKSYLSGSNYLRKMSTYKTGEWSATWDALYWRFIHTHQDFFARNHRLSMMPKILEKMTPGKRQALLHQAATYLESLA